MNNCTSEFLAFVTHKTKISCKMKPFPPFVENLSDQTEPTLGMINLFFLLSMPGFTVKLTDFQI